MIRFKSLAAQDQHRQDERERERETILHNAVIKSALVSQLTGSLPLKIASVCNEFPYPAGFDPPSHLLSAMSFSTLLDLISPKVLNPDSKL